MRGFQHGLAITEQKFHEIRQAAKRLVTQFGGEKADDARKRVLREIEQRQGQPAFRQDLLKAYGGRCAVSDCDAEEALEAAHIEGYRGAASQMVTNGLLLRCDIHTLFDLDLLAIVPDKLSIYLTKRLRRTSYAEFHGKPLRLPQRVQWHPDITAIAKRWDKFNVSK